MSARIAVVEDEAEIRDLIVEELEDCGYEIATADNGQTGLNMIREFKPDLVLSDITMPVLDGYGMLAQLRDDASFRTTPVVFLSALADRRHIIQGKKLGVDDYVTKPIDFEYLLVTVEARLREVQRMKDEKEEQMKKLYNSFMAEPAVRRARPALILAQEWMDVEPIEKSLNSLGVPFIIQHRGSQLDEYLQERTYSALFLAEYTNDLNAKETLEKSQEFEGMKLPKYLLIEDSQMAQDMSFWTSFHRIISLDYAEDADINELIADQI